jgi:alpha-L-rhamnosidase
MRVKSGVIAILGISLCLVPAPAVEPGATGPTGLRVERLENPLGLDEPAPRFSWQLRDSKPGAKQSAYEVVVASEPGQLAAGQGTIWQSGRVESSQSMNVRYGGPALKPSTRYYWRVRVWGENNKLYSPSQASWWETGLMDPQAWKADWIGYETPEEAAVRHASAQWITTRDKPMRTDSAIPEERTDYRLGVTIDKPVRRATLYATGEDTVAAWINGAQVMNEAPLPPWKQMPWKKFVRADVTTNLNPGTNSLAIETLHYVVNPSGAVNQESSPMIATLYVEYADGSVATFDSGPQWKAAVSPTEGWQQKDFDDSAWKQAYVPELTTQRFDSPPAHPWIPDSVKALRHTFEVASPVRSARLYATALGTYEIYLNGKPVSEDFFAPGWTDYRQHVVYQTYDVTALVANGKNTISALLAPGWYSTPLEWFQQPNNYGVTPPALRAQLRVEHQDGSVQWVLTGADWKANGSEIVSSELYDGETQDARRAEPGWQTSAFAAKDWHDAQVIEPAAIAIEAQYFPPIRAERIVTATSMTEPRNGVFVYDLGQNLVGVERLKVNGSLGAKVRLRFAEIVNKDGTIYTDNLRTAKATDYFTLKGGPQTLEPQFTFHGFRYIEITGLPAPPPTDSVSAVVLHTAAPFTAELATSSSMINKLWSNILWGQRSNFVGVPTDCPQRDERLGWMADAQVFWRAASFNMDLAAFSRKFSADMRGTQAGTPYYGIFAPGTTQPHSGSGAGWSDAGVVIPWTSWLQNGDLKVIDENWTAMEKYLAAIAAANPDGLWKVDNGIPFGDWLSPEGKTDFTLISTAYWAYDVTLMKQMAHATGRTADEEKYARLFEKIRAAFQKEFIHDDGFIAGADNSPSPFGQINNPNAMSKGGDTQTGYVLALHMNLVPAALRAKAAQHLVDKIEANHDLLGTGFLGTPYLLEELTKTGHEDLAYKLLLNTRYPSWGYLVEHGATTMWERWNGDQMKADPSMNSYNHYAYGAVADWIYRYAAGVDTTPLDAGFHTVLLHPTFDARLDSVNFSYQSAYGTIRSSWTVKGQTAEWNLTLPANTTGWLPTNTPSRFTFRGIQPGATGLVVQTKRDEQSGFQLASGSYSIEVTLK